jgi:hypothetical protein
MPIEHLIPGFAHHARVFEIGAIGAFETTDGELIESRSWGNGLTCEIGGYQLAAKREDAWNAIVAVLLSFESEHRHRFGELMSDLRWLSNSKPEIEPLDTLLETSSQMMFDVASEREGRREKKGFASPADARAFLQMSRCVLPEAAPAPNPIARAYFRSIDPPPEVDESPAPRDEAAVEVVELLTEAGVLPQHAPQGLLTGAQDQPPSWLAQMHCQLHRS